MILSSSRSSPLEVCPTAINLIEEIYLSCVITKYNRYGMKQNRNLIITNLHCMNVSKQSIPPIPYLRFVEINRKINIIQVDAVTISQNSKCHELVIHVKGEYDYRYVSPNYHELVATYIRSIVRIKGLKASLYKVVRVSIH